jgi:hypothetical protein
MVVQCSKYLLKGVMPKRSTMPQKKYLAYKVKPFVLQEGTLYEFKQDNRFRQVV